MLWNERCILYHCLRKCIQQVHTILHIIIVLHHPVIRFFFPVAKCKLSEKITAIKSRLIIKNFKVILL